MDGEGSYLIEIPKDAGKNLHSVSFDCFKQREAYEKINRKLSDYTKNLVHAQGFTRSYLFFYLIGGNVVEEGSVRIRLSSETPAGLESILALFEVRRPENP